MLQRCPATPAVRAGARHRRAAPAAPTTAQTVSLSASGNRNDDRDTLAFQVSMLAKSTLAVSPASFPAPPPIV